MALKLIFAGTPDFAVPTLQKLIDSEHEVVAVYSQPDRVSGRGQHVTASPVKQLALENELNIFQPADLRDKNEQEKIKAFEADALIVVAYGLILPQAVLDATKFGGLNLHPSLLPKWRGAAPIQHTLLNNENKTAISVIQMNAKMDAGDILLQTPYFIAPDDTAAFLHNQFADIGAGLMLRTLSRLENKTLEPIKQNESDVTFANKINKADGKIDWHDSAKNIAAKVRAFNSWPGAFFEFKKQNLKVWDAVAYLEYTDLKPGEVVRANKNGIDIATGDGVLRLLSLQLPGKKRTAVADFLNSHKNDFLQGN